MTMKSHTFKFIGHDDEDFAPIVSMFEGDNEAAIYYEGNGDFGVIVVSKADEEGCELLNETHHAFNEAVGALTRFLYIEYEGAF